MSSLLVRTSAVEFISRSRGSSHRSYWRPAGQQQLFLFLWMVKNSFCDFWYPSVSNRKIAKHFFHKLRRFCSRGSCRKHLVHLGGAGESSVSAICVALKGVMCWATLFSRNMIPPEIRVIRLVRILRITYLIKRGVYFVIENPSTSLLWRYKCVKVSQLMFTVAAARI